MQRLEPFHVLAIFASLLLERRIIFVAERLGTLSSCIQASVALLYPFTWQVSLSLLSLGPGFQFPPHVDILKSNTLLVVVNVVPVSAHIYSSPATLHDLLCLCSYALLHWNS